MTEKAINKFVVNNISGSIYGYIYNVQMLTSIDGGDHYYYAGNGRFCRSMEEVNEYIKENAK